MNVKKNYRKIGNKKDIYILWGVKDQEAHVNIYIGPRAQSKEEPLIGHGKNPPRPWM